MVSPDPATRYRRFIDSVIDHRLCRPPPTATRPQATPYVASDRGDHAHRGGAGHWPAPGRRAPDTSHSEEIGDQRPARPGRVAMGTPG